MTLAANDPFAAFKRLQFSNGLQAFVLTMPGRTAEHVQFVLNVGAGDDPDAFLGLAHYTEHMVCCDNEMTIARLSS